MAKKKSKKPNNFAQNKPKTTSVSPNLEQSPTTSETQTEFSKNSAENVVEELGVAVDEQQSPQNDGSQQTDGANVTPSDEAQPDAPPPNVEELKTRRWLPYVIAVAVLTVITLVCAIPFNGYSGGDAKPLVGAWSSAFTVPGIICLGVGLLIWCTNEGAFDMLSYGVKSLFRLFKKDVKDRKYGGYYEYQQARKNKKKPFLYMVVVGGAYLLVGIILTIIYSQMPVQ